MSIEVYQMEQVGDEVRETSGTHIGDALNLLRNELLLLQEQDVQLLKQLMNVHYSIRMLRRKFSRRTSSFSTLASPPASLRNALLHARTGALVNAPSADSGHSNTSGGGGSKPRGYATLPAKSCLSRVMSEPARSLAYQRSLSVTTEEDEDPGYQDDDLDELAYNSTDSEAADPLMASLNIDPEMSALLTDMPKALRRKYLKSLNHNSYILGRMPSNDSVKLPNTNTSHGNNSKVIIEDRTESNLASVQTRCGSSHRENKSSSVRRLCRADAIHEGSVVFNNCRGDMNESIADDSDSDCGIQITAL